ncbi:hypothetical protein E2C01_035430 [Portunus trituberculatus]|uniref:Uncharacterized protein n=1 Tax=Portunus trituberculatus TaxID=210409 RepID=A0A5B7F9R0_PORTR|nr:hypothetical protein [Portunus trituberculatus]
MRGKKTNSIVRHHGLTPSTTSTIFKSADSIKKAENLREVLAPLEAAGAPIEAVDVNSEADNGVGWEVVVGVSITRLDSLPRPLVALRGLTG